MGKAAAPEHAGRMREKARGGQPSAGGAARLVRKSCREAGGAALREREVRAVMPGTAAGRQARAGVPKPASVERSVISHVDVKLTAVLRYAD